MRAGRFRSEAHFLAEVGLSSGYLGEFATRIEKNPAASMRTATMSRVSELLGVPVAALLAENDETEPPVVDIYPERAWAIAAARNLQLPEAAIQLVLKEDPGKDPGRLYWFHRIESEAERVRPASSG